MSWKVTKNTLSSLFRAKKIMIQENSDMRNCISLLINGKSSKPFQLSLADFHQDAEKKDQYKREIYSFNSYDALRTDVSRIIQERKRGDLNLAQGFELLLTELSTYFKQEKSQESQPKETETTKKDWHHSETYYGGAW